MRILHLVDHLLDFLLGEPVEQLFRIGEPCVPGLLISNGLNVKYGYIVIIDVFPGFVGRGHDVQFGVVEGSPLVELDHVVFGRVA